MATTKKAIEIFYIEDKKTDVLLFDFALKEIDIPTFLITATDGTEAMEFLQSDHFSPDIIFIDVKLPRISGIDCLTAIRKMKRFDDTPVIMFSIFEDGKYVEKAYKEKANMYIQKPFNINQQIKMLKKILTTDWRKHYTHSSPEEFVFKA